MTTLTLNIDEMKPQVAIRGLVLATGLLMASCTSMHEDAALCTLKPAFVHRDLVIKGWKRPPINDGHLLPQTEILIRDKGSKSDRWIPLRRYQSFGGFTLSRVDGRPDTIGGPATGLAAVSTTDISLRVSNGLPKRFLILRDISGYATAFYSDSPHPSLHRN